MRRNCILWQNFIEDQCCWKNNIHFSQNKYECRTLIDVEMKRVQRITISFMRTPSKVHRFYRIKEEVVN